MDSNWVLVVFDPYHKYWSQFSEAMKLDRLVVTEDDPIKDVVIKIVNRPRSQVRRAEYFETFKVVVEYVSEDQSDVYVYKKGPDIGA